MKRYVYIAVPVLITTIGAFAAESQWTYNSIAGTISDGDWTFAATASGTDLTVGAHSANPAVVPNPKIIRNITYRNTD